MPPMPKISSMLRVTAQGMLYANTPIEYYDQYDLSVKREDMACPPPGPPFSKARGVYARVKSRPEKLIGVLDTAHSQAGHAVARACQILGKRCLNFYPEFKHTPGPKPPQVAAKALGAALEGLPAGRSAILYHAARRRIEALGGYLMPNALKLEESVTETAKEVPNRKFDYVIIPASSGTIAAGVIKGFEERSLPSNYVIHLGYSRSHDEVEKYIHQASGYCPDLIIVDESYAYKDQAMEGETPPWPCNSYYDLKAFRYLMRNREKFSGSVLLWNIG